MFLQVIRGPVRDEAGAHEIMESWMDELRPGAVGWLGTTAGVTPDGELVVLARFSSEEEARRNSERPEQDEWWARARSQFTGPVTFRDCTDVALVAGGGSDDAGFVQVIEAAAVDLTAAELAEVTERYAGTYRPDIIGGIIGITDDGIACQAVYFTSEQEARAGEAAEQPPEAETDWEGVAERLGEFSYLDLPSPRLYS